MADIVQSEPAKVPIYKIVAAFLAIYLIWGTTFLGIRIAIETIPPFMMAGLRFSLAGGTLLLITLAQGGHFPGLLYWRSAVIIGGLMLVGGIGMVSFAEKRIPSGLAALVVATIPIWMALFGWLVFGGRQPSLQVFTGLALGFVGAILLFVPALDTNADRDHLIGMGIVLLAAISFSIGGLYSRRAPLPEDTQTGTASEMLAGGTLLLIISTLVGEPTHLDVGNISLRSVLALAYLTVFGSIIGYTAYLWLLKTVEPAKVSTNFYVNPVVAIIAGWLVVDETVTPSMIVAALVILLGVAVINTRLPHLRPRREIEVTLESASTD